MRIRFGAAVLGLIGISAAGLCLAPPARASSGEITRAEASSDWTHASIAGSVTWTGCENAVTPPLPPPDPPGPEEPEGEPRPESAPESPESPYCGWRAFAALSPSPNCESPARVTVWSEGERTDLATASFELPEVPLGGQPGQYLCLGATEIAQTEQMLPCAPPARPLPPGWHCPYETASYPHLLASAPLTAGETQGGAPAEAPTGEPATHLRHPRRCRRDRKHPGSRKFRCWRHHRHKHHRRRGHRRHGRHSSAKKN